MQYLNRQYTIKLVTILVLYLCVITVFLVLESGNSSALNLKEEKEMAVERKRIKNVTQGDILQQYDSLLEQNPDVIGMIHMPGITEKYPVLLGRDNSYYLTHNVYRNMTDEGAICADYVYQDTNIRDEFQRHTLLYGRNQKDGSMFGMLHSYMDKKFLKKHPYIEFDNLTMVGKWRVFSAYTIDADQESILRTFQNDTEYIEYLKRIKERSKFAIDVTLTKEDKILTLCTGTGKSENTRMIVHAVLVK